jgi:hypothetical protein
MSSNDKEYLTSSIFQLPWFYTRDHQLEDGPGHEVHRSGDEEDQQVAAGELQDESHEGSGQCAPDRPGKTRHTHHSRHGIAGEDIGDHREYVGGNKRDIHEAEIQHLKNAAEAYKYVAKKYNWIIIDCAPNGKLKTKQEIHEIIWNKINDLL